MESAFLADVRAAVAEGAAVYVEVGMGVSESFEANVAALGVPIQRLSTLGARAMLYEIIDDGEGT